MHERIICYNIVLYITFKIIAFWNKLILFRVIEVYFNKVYFINSYFTLLLEYFIQ